MAGKDPRRIKLRAIVERDSLTGYMNDTKWMRLIEGLRSLTVPVRHRVKLISDDEPTEWTGLWLGDVPRYYVELPSLGPVLVAEIEWIEIDASGSTHPGWRGWVPAVEHAPVVAALLDEVRAPYTREGDLFRIIGYIRRQPAP